VSAPAPKMNHAAVLRMIDTISEYAVSDTTEICLTFRCLRPAGHRGKHFPTRSMVEVRKVHP
jgi:hypothetical protein